MIAQVVNPRVFKNVYYISLANLAGGNRTFEEAFKWTHPDVDIDKVRSPSKCPQTFSETEPTLLLIDEGQVGICKNLSFRGIIKRIMVGSKPHLRIIVVSTWDNDVVVEGGQIHVTHVAFKA